jgi:CTP:molybdopterin cytidylyltransferase MocA
MGSPKALMRYRGETFLDRLIGLFSERCAPVIVVLGAGAENIRTGIARTACFVLNEDYRSGQTSSMQCGLRAVPADAEGVLFTLVDHPAVDDATIDALLGPADRSLIRIPRYQGERGHPIWFRRDLIGEFLAVPSTGAARDVVRKHRADTQWIDVENAGILADIDDPVAYRNLIGAGR